MRGLNLKLGFLLVVQILIAAVLLGMQAHDRQHEDRPLLPVSFSEVDEIRILEQGKAPVVLKKEDNWVLPEQQNLPVDAGRIQELENALSSVRLGWPVAQSSSSATRFKVSENAFNRKVELLDDGKPQLTFYLGTSPGYRKQHLRLVSENEIFAAQLALHVFNSNDQSWLDKSVLALNGDMQKARVGNLNFSLEENEWRAQEEAKAFDADSEKLQTWLNRFKTLRVQALADEDALKSLDLNAPSLQVSITSNEQTTTYDFFKSEDDHFIRKDGGHVFRLAAHTYTTLTEVDRAQFEADLSEGAQEEQDISSEDTTSSQD